MKSLSEEFIDFLKEISEYDAPSYYDNFLNIEQHLTEQRELYSQRSKDEIESFCKELCVYVQNKPYYEYIQMMSFCMYLSKNSYYTKQILQYALESKDIDVFRKYFLYFQIANKEFVEPALKDIESDKLQYALYRTCYWEFYDAFEKKFEWIPVKERNAGLVFVLTDQLLGPIHAPTKTTLDRSFVLQKYLGKKVFLINTAMFAPQKGTVPFYKMGLANYVDAYSDITELEYKGEHFAFYQCPKTMPDIGTMSILIDFVKNNKPYCIFDIGGSNLMSDLCSNLVPVITINTVFSALSMCMGQFQALGRAITEEDKAILRYRNREDSHIIQSHFTFVFKDQEHKYTREELGFPENAFILLVVGYRLAHEMSEEFLEMVDEVLDEYVHVAFMGKVENYDDIIEKYSNIRIHSTNLGIKEDALAIMECCDLYINPKRNGGGSSIAEALYKGVPAVTLPYGDASLSSGEQFWVQNFRQMKDVILRYAEDREFYRQKSEEAVKRAEVLLDSASAFREVLQEAESRLEFR